MLCEDTHPAKSAALHASCVRLWVQLVMIPGSVTDNVYRSAPHKLLQLKPRSVKMGVEEQLAMIST
jgi:hypothetical protein